MEKFKPLKNKLLVKRDEVAEKTQGGLFLPDEAKQSQRPFIGTVMEVGNEAKDIHKNDRVFFSKYAGLEIELDKVSHLILEDSDILGLFVNE